MRRLRSRAQEARLKRVQASPRFAGGQFHNTAPVDQGLKKGTHLSTTREFVFGRQRRVPKATFPLVDPREPWQRPTQSGLRVTWLGHSTTLVEIDGFRVLTDPVWGERASPVAFAGPKRFHPAPVSIEQLPQLDAIVISHDHYDHLDRPSITRLLALGVPFVTSLGVGAHLEAWGVPAERIFELDWWESIELRGLTITAAPAQHFSGRGLGDRNATSWSSFVLCGPRHTVFFSGDTGLTEEYREIRERFGSFDLIMLEVGAWDPAWDDIHLGPANALHAHAMLGGGAFLPVHWGTFNLGLHAWNEPAEDLLKLRPSDAPLIMPRLGQPVEPRHVELIDPWWREVEETGTAPSPVRAPHRQGEPAPVRGGDHRLRR
ncbi:MBL fold metallo-hydrolase [Myxococcus sp. SDU36]|uniref:MBL fold metallo-hydrolase n=1 Tax=Myxococcus sp. SDU36 TaxID=2831967 RepID=UPI0025432CFE|nr:MBL fold metallo-hydrolase [Myxococcus sp. SDU36]WIG98840.1 MBL fold metallo-hydrolase [Myxococcus sp. SDU36]